MRIGIDAGGTHTDAVILRGRTVVASVPDRITMVDHETSSPINSGRVHYGQRVAAFGVDIDFVPLEEL